MLYVYRCHWKGLQVKKTYNHVLYYYHYIAIIQRKFKSRGSKWKKIRIFLLTAEKKGIQHVQEQSNNSEP